MRWLAISVVLVACGSEQARPALGDAGNERECLPTTTQGCTCIEGSGGVKQCGANGVWEACVCGGQTDDRDSGLAEQDAGDASDGGCQPEPVSSDPASSSCIVFGSCSSCNAGTGFACSVINGIRQQPSSRAGNPFVGCRRVAEGTDTTNYCCPDDCVRSRALDVHCDSAGALRAAMACASEAKASALVAGGSCTRRNKVDENIVVCCL